MDVSPEFPRGGWWLRRVVKNYPLEVPLANMRSYGNSRGSHHVFATVSQTLSRESPFLLGSGSIVPHGSRFPATHRLLSGRSQAGRGLGLGSARCRPSGQTQAVAELVRSAERPRRDPRVSDDLATQGA